MATKPTLNNKQNHDEIQMTSRQVGQYLIVYERGAEQTLVVV